MRHGANKQNGRWPANVIHDGSDEVVGLFPVQVKDGEEASTARFFYCAKASKADRDAGCEGLDAGGLGVAMRGNSMEPYHVRVHSPEPQVIAAYLREWRERAGMTKAQADEVVGGTTLYSWFEGRPAGTQLPTPANWLKLKAAFGFDDKHDAEMLETRLQDKSGFDNSEPRRNHHPTVKPTALMRYLCRLVTPPGGVVLDLNPEYIEIARGRVAQAARQSTTLF
jgi:hypothetical protein